MGFGKIGVEFLVNTTTADFQGESSAAALTGGRFVVTWMDLSASGGDTSRGAVRGQIFNADGSKSGGEFLVNTTTEDTQGTSSVAALAGGRFVVTWTDMSETGGDTSLRAVRGQMFNADGSKSGVEFLVSTTTANAQYLTSVTALSGGRFVVTWSDFSKTGGDLNGWAVRSQIFNADGSKSGDEFVVNTTTVNDQGGSNVTTLKDGRFVVTWNDTSGIRGDLSDFAVRGQIFDADGSKRGGEFLVNRTTAGHQLDSDATPLADGGFVVTWTDGSRTGSDTSGAAVRGQIFNADGTKRGGEFLVNTKTANNQQGSNVTSLADGRFVVTWNDEIGTDSWTIRGQVFSADGLKSGAEFRVTMATSIYEYDESSIEALGDGRFVVTWTNRNGDANGNAVRAQIFDATRYLGDATDEAVTGGTLADTVDGADGNDSLRGELGNDTLRGGLGNDMLNGGLGTDRMEGGSGNDIYWVDNLRDVVVEGAGQGTDTVYSSLTFVLGQNVENLVLTGAAASDGIGNGLDNTIIGNAAANRLNGGAGNDRLNGNVGADGMEGGSGNDVYWVDNVHDVVVEAAGQGTDTVNSSLTFVLGQNVENLVLTGAAAINGTGNGFDNTIIGNAAANRLSGGVGNDRLNGGAAADRMEGGSGNDVYWVDNVNDVVVEVAGQGTDTVNSSLTFVLGQNLENLVLTGTANISGTGNGFDNTIIGNAAANRLNGGAGNDRLNGGAGIDRMEGGSGNDVYWVGNIRDTVVEAAGQGTDTVYSSQTFALGHNVENLMLTGMAAIDGTGNGLDNAIAGNAGANWLQGGAGNDRLNGGADDDRLNGNTGADRMEGGSGNDIYWVDNIRDVVVEGAGQGEDTVHSSMTFMLGQNVEYLILNGTAAINGTGNGLSNVIVGTVAANTLNGAAGDDWLLGGGGNDRLIGGSGDDYLEGDAGADRMEGGSGDDIYWVDSIGDVVVEAAGQGTDAVFSSETFVLGQNVEYLILNGTAAIDGTGNGLSNVIAGTVAANILNGAAGDDRLLGGGGNDRLIGGSGDDSFVFSTVLSSPGNRATIADFSNQSGNNDTILLYNPVFTKLAAGALNAANFRLGAAAVDANDYVVYNRSTGVLSYDADGNGVGAAVQIALLSNKAALSSADFQVI